MKTTSRRELERGPGGYHTRRPANFDLFSGRPIDGRSVGSSESWSGMFAAVLPDPLGQDRMAVRLFGRTVTVIIDGDYVEGTQAEVVAALRDHAAALERQAADLPAALAAVAEAEERWRSLAGFAAEGFHHHHVRPAVFRRNVAEGAAHLATKAKEAADRLERLVLPVPGLEIGTDVRRPATGVLR